MNLQLRVSKVSSTTAPFQPTCSPITWDSPKSVASIHVIKIARARRERFFLAPIISQVIMGCGAATGRVAPEMTEGQCFRKMHVSGPQVCVDQAVRNGEFAPARTRGGKAKSSLNSDNFASVVESLMKMWFFHVFFFQKKISAFCVFFLNLFLVFLGLTRMFFCHLFIWVNVIPHRPKKSWRIHQKTHVCFRRRI